MRPSILEAADLLRRSTYTVALTGAGISTPSGIPDFRSHSSGLWNRFDPMEVASLWAFHERPDRFYEWIVPLLHKMRVARPNAAHRTLAAMEEAGLLRATVTQNIDSLHQMAGSRQVHELHGHARTATCLECGLVTPAEPLVAQVLAGGPPPHCAECGGPLKPDVILFGEPLPYDVLIRAQQESLHAEVLLVIGTSLEVMPAADLPLLAKRRGARLIFINLQSTLLDGEADILIQADVVRVLDEIRQFLRC